MGDLEFRGCGWRFFLVVERWKKADPDPPQPVQGHAGHFERNSSIYYDDKSVTLGFGRTP